MIYNGLIYIDGYSYVTMINEEIHVINVRPHDVVKYLFKGYSFIGFYNV